MKLLVVVQCLSVKLKLTLTDPLLQKSLRDAVVEPFLGAYNKRAAPLTVRCLRCVLLSGRVLLRPPPSLATVLAASRMSRIVPELACECGTCSSQYPLFSISGRVFVCSPPVSGQGRVVEHAKIEVSCERIHVPLRLVCL